MWYELWILRVLEVHHKQSCPWVYNISMHHKSINEFCVCFCKFLHESCVGGAECYQICWLILGSLNHSDLMFVLTFPQELVADRFAIFCVMTSSWEIQCSALCIYAGLYSCFILNEFTDALLYIDHVMHVWSRCRGMLERFNTESDICSSNEIASLPSKKVLNQLF